jgi:glycosyltransferase involved in cell wall biosynthesis
MSTSQLFDYERSAPKEFIKRVLVAAFHSGFVGGRTHQEYLDRLGMPAGHVTWGYNAVENDYFRKKAADVRHEADALRAEHNLPGSYFLVVGRMVEEKNLSRLLEAYAAYHSEASHPIHLVVVGDGPLRQDFRIQVKAYNLNNAVHTPGFVQYDELPVYYGLAHSLLLPSVKDTWGLVVNEAMASGLPLLVSDRCGCSTHLVEDGDNGYIISPYDVDEIEDALHRLSALSDEEYATMCQASSNRIKEWGPKRFAQGLWKAASRAQRRASTYTAPAHVRLMSRLVSFLPLSA